jgi:CHRD domain
MNQGKRILLNFALGILTCLFLVGVAAPSFSKNAPTPLQQSLIQQSVALNLKKAEAVLLAQDSPTAASPMTRFVAVMQSSTVVPIPSSNYSFGAAGAVLVGNRLVMRGDFSNLTSPLRDYATDPLSPPNPNITSAIHIHRGEPMKNGPFQYALEVETMDSTKGRFKGEYTLTDEQLQALSSGNLYVDLHTKQNRGGELRGALKPY